MQPPFGRKICLDTGPCSSKFTVILELHCKRMLLKNCSFFGTGNVHKQVLEAGEYLINNPQ